MAVYRFRIAFEDQEDVVREIEILGKHSFGDLHRSIQEAIGFDNSKDASFYMSDDYWRKGQEITNRKFQEDYDDDDDYRGKKKPSAKPMNTSRIADFIDDPHQKIVYEFDPAVKWTLLIELVRILTEDAKGTYPKTVKSSGAAPKQYKQVIAPPVEDEDDDEEDEEDKKEREREKTFKMEEDYDEDAAEGAEEDEGGVGGDDAEEAAEESEEPESDEGGDFASSGEEEY